MIDDLLDLLHQTMARAYAPYSQFPVAAVVRADSGVLYAGCNVENAAYPQGWCAETSAIAAMVTAGDRRIVEVAVMGQGNALVTPCGGCRQRIREFADPETTPIHIYDPGGLCKTMTLQELLPLSFGPDNLK